MDAHHVLCDAESLQEQDLLTQELTETQPPSSDNEAEEDGTPVYGPPNEQASKLLTSLSESRSEKERSALRHYDCYISKCSCDTQCGFEGSKQLSFSFAQLDQATRKQTVRAMLLTLTAPSKCPNGLMKTPMQWSQKRKHSMLSGSTSGRVTTRYAIRGLFMCASAFAAVVQLYPRTVSSLATEIASKKTYSIPKHNSHKRRSGLLTAQTLVTLHFLERHAQLNAMACPSGRGSAEDAPVVFLPSSTTTESVHKLYERDWKTIMDAHFDMSGTTQQRPICPLTTASFRRVWRQYYPTLRVMKKGSDFCDTCTKLGNQVQATTDANTREALERARSQHRCEAATEFKYYKKVQSRCKGDGTTMHMVFDFAEKVLLPHLLRQPGQLHFVTGLKFDFFAIHVSNDGITRIFGLPEGHWPSNKTANEVGSMLHYCIESYKSEADGVKHIRLHADNCGGQNKNKFILFYLAWRVLSGREESITLHFLVAGHTKNVCDGAFGLVKRKVKQRNVIIPREMMEVIEDSSTSNKVISSSSIEWFQWKVILSRFMCVPGSFRITKYHWFLFRADAPGFVFVKNLSNSEEEVRIRLIKRSADASDIVAATSYEHLKETLCKTKPLCSVASLQEGNRKAFLLKNVLERYYATDNELHSAYFGDGSDWGQQ